MGRERCVNFHPGILPGYKGAGAFSWSIINGEKKCGITLHEIDPDIDNGPIIEIGDFPIEGWDTAETLFKKGEEKIFEMFTKWYEYILTGNYKTKHQTEKGHIYYRKDLNKMKNLTKIVRALTFTGKESCYYVNREGQRIDLTY